MPLYFRRDGFVGPLLDLNRASLLLPLVGEGARGAPSPAHFYEVDSLKR